MASFAPSQTQSPHFQKVLAALWLLLFLGIPSLAIEPKGSNSAGTKEHFEAAFRQGSDQGSTIEERMAAHRVPGLSIAVIQDHQIAWAQGYGLISADDEAGVNTQTVFSVGSVSKLVAAVVCLRLVEQGKLKLDEDVNQFLTSWQVPPNAFTEKQPVTLRHIMSHTAGFTVHGFPDFQPGEALPTTLDTLKGRSPAKHGPVVVNFAPGSEFRYSGGGITVEQLMIEEATGETFPKAAQSLVFKELGMERSTYENPIPAEHGNIAKAHSQTGRLRALPRGWEAMPEMAASGLWTTPSELAKLMIVLMKAYHGKHDSFLKPATIKDMLTPVQPSTFGLGPQFFKENLFGHGGSNNSYKAQVIANLKTGNGIVILTNGANGKRMIREVIDTMKLLEGW